VRVDATLADAGEVGGFGDFAGGTVAVGDGFEVARDDAGGGVAVGGVVIIIVVVGRGVENLGGGMAVGVRRRVAVMVMVRGMVLVMC
jgi:hypothetical protein